MSYIVKQLPLRRVLLTVEYYSDAKLGADVKALEKRVTGIAFDHLGGVEVVKAKRVFRKGLRARKSREVL